MVDVISKSAELSKQAQEQGTQQYFYDPYSGTLIVASPEGIVLTQIGGQTVSSKTPAQVQLEKQIQGAGGTVTHDVSEQIAVGLQEQTKTALIGQQPESFEIITSEFKAKATGGITSEYMRGATGSILKAGYENVDGLEVPASQKFKTTTGQEFTATPTGSSALGGFLWETPYGEIRATPETLEKEIERQMDVTAITEQSMQRMKDIELVEKESRTLPARLEFALEHPTKGLEYMIGSEILYKNPLDIRGMEKYEKERELWMESYMRTPPGEFDFTKPGWIVKALNTRSGKFALTGMSEPIMMVAGGKALSMIPGLAETKIGTKILSLPFAKQVLIGAGLGITTGTLTIGTIESVKGYRTGEPGTLGRGVMLAIAGALGTKFVWETGVVPELKEFIIVRQTTKGFSVSKIEMRSDDAFAGTGKAVYDTKISGDEIVTKTDFLFAGKKVNDKLTIEIGYGEMESKAVEKDLLYGSWKTNLIDLPGQTFVAEDISAALPNDRFTLSGWETATKSVEKTMFNEKVVGLSISEKMFEDEFKTIFKTAGKTRIQDIFSIDTVIDETKIPFEFFGGGGTSSELIESGTPGSLDIIKAVQKDIMGMHTRAALEFEFNKAAEPDLNILIPGLTKTDIRTETKEDMFNISIPKTDVMQVEKTKEKEFIGASIGLEITEVFEESKEEQDIFNVSFTGVGTAQSQRQSDLELTETLQLTDLATDFGFAPPHADIELEPGTTIIPGGGWDFGFAEEPFKKGKGGGGRGFIDVPSWVALELGIHGKMPKHLTGLEIRPITGKGRSNRDDELEIDF
jgi:hypothetical protein